MFASIGRPARGVLAAVCVAVCALTLLIAPKFNATAVGETTFRNPLLANGADPWLQFHDGNYYLATTTWNSAAGHAQVAHAGRPAHRRAGARLVGDRRGQLLQLLGVRVPPADRPERHPLVPDVHRRARSANLDGQKLRVLESAGDDPMGPYTLQGYADADARGTSTAATCTVGGQLYLLWSEWQGADQSIWIARMTNPWTITGSRRC